MAKFVLFLSCFISFAYCSPLNKEIPSLNFKKDSQIDRGFGDEVLLKNNPLLEYYGHYRGKLYYGTQSLVNWNQANEFCRSLSMNLVAFEDILESTYVFSVTPITLFWTSGIDTGRQDQVHWDTGSQNITLVLYGGVMKNTCVLFDSITGSPSAGQIYTVKCDEPIFPLCQTN